MSPVLRAVLQLLVLALVVCGLIFAFPKAGAFAEMAARDLRYFWWLVLIVVLALWLIVGLGKKRR